MKCSVYYKIGYSKNPENRLKTVKTHNPLDVKLLATLKTKKSRSLEKELHNLFLPKNSRREWFELHYQDLLKLKIDYGFNFLEPIEYITDDYKEDEYTLGKIKEIRIDNAKLDALKTYFENLFETEIVDNIPMKKCSLNFDSELIIKAIDNLFEQGKDADTCYKLIYTVCCNLQESKENPGRYFAKVVRALLYKQYGYELMDRDFDYISNNFNKDSNVSKAIREINSRKFYLNITEFLVFINDKFII